MIEANIQAFCDDGASAMGPEMTIDWPSAPGRVKVSYEWDATDGDYDQGKCSTSCIDAMYKIFRACSSKTNPVPL